MEVRFLLREMQSLGLLNCIRDWNGTLALWLWLAYIFGKFNWFLTESMWDLRWRSGKEIIHPDVTALKSSKKRLNLSESKPSTSTYACALDWKEWEALFPNICFQSICGFAWFEFCSPEGGCLSETVFSSFQNFNKNFKHLNVCKWNVESFNQMPKSH